MMHRPPCRMLRHVRGADERGEMTFMVRSLLRRNPRDWMVASRIIVSDRWRVRRSTVIIVRCILVPADGRESRNHHVHVWSKQWPGACLFSGGRSGLAGCPVALRRSPPGNLVHQASPPSPVEPTWNERFATCRTMAVVDDYVTQTLQAPRSCF